MNRHSKLLVDVDPTWVPKHSVSALLVDDLPPGYEEAARAQEAARHARLPEPNPHKAVSQVKTRAAVWDKTGGRCWYCGAQTNPWRDFAIDHVQARTQGGTSDLSNLVPTCKGCNSRKNKHGVEHLRATLAQQRGTPFTFYFETLTGEIKHG